MMISQKLIYIADVEKIINRSRLTIRRMWKANKFPKPIYLNNRLCWPTAVVNKWLADNHKIFDNDNINYNPTITKTISKEEIREEIIEYLKKETHEILKAYFDNMLISFKKIMNMTIDEMTKKCK